MRTKPCEIIDCGQNTYLSYLLPISITSEKICSVKRNRLNGFLANRKVIRNLCAV